MTKFIKLIYTTERKGFGDEKDDTVRRVEQLWTENGLLVAENDPCGESFFKGVPNL